MAKIPAFKPVKSSDQTLTLIQSNIASSLAPALSAPILGGTYVTATFPQANTDLVVTHNLGDAGSVCYLVGTSSAACNIYLSPNTNPIPAQMINLRSSVAGVTVGLYFFNSGKTALSISGSPAHPSTSTPTSGTSLTLTGTLTVDGLSTFGVVDATTLNVSGLTTLSNVTISGSLVAPVGGDLSGSLPDPLVVGLRGTPIANITPSNGQILELVGGIWTPVTAGGSTPIGPAGGDLSGTYPNPKVVGLQTVPVSTTAPLVGQGLVYNGSAWVPATPPVLPPTSDIETCQVVQFTYQTASPMLLQAVQAGCVIDRVLVYISTPFSDPAATLQLGITANVNLVLGTGDTDPAASEQYSNQALTTVPANDYFIFTITPGASTQGAGTLFFRVSAGSPGV